MDFNAIARAAIVAAIAAATAEFLNQKLNGRNVSSVSELPS